MTVKERVEDNLGLVNMIVRRYIGRGTDYEDLFQIGSLGLLKAAQNFDESRQLQFSTYAVSKIVGEIKTYFRDNGAVKISRNVKEQLYKIKNAKEYLSRKSGRQPTIHEISQMTGLSPEEIIEYTEINDTVLSLDLESEQGGSLYDAIGENTTENDLERINLICALDKLEAKERQIIVMRYFLDKTQAQTAAALGLTQVSVSRQEKNILKKLLKMIS